MSNERIYDIIGYGDEVPGIMAMVAAAREFRRRTSRYPRVLLLSKGPSRQGTGGHLVRGRLAYLDRSQVPRSLRQRFRLPTFGDPPALYKELLQNTGVQTIALDPQKADDALKQMCRQAGVAFLRDVKIETVLKNGNRIDGIRLQRGETYRGKQFIDSTVHAELAQAAGAAFAPGFSNLGLPESELSVTLVFETRGLSPARLRYVEDLYLQRFTNPADRDAQTWLHMAAGSDHAFADQLRQRLVDSNGRRRRMFEGNDYIDVRSPALSIAYHSFRKSTFSISQSGSVLDQGNIAKFSGDRLIWNALLFDVNASEALTLAQNNAQPTAKMWEEMNFIEEWFKSLGATAVIPAEELYIRHAGNIQNPVEALTGTQMLRGGVSEREGLGTFGYHFDIRGGIKGLERNANRQGIFDLRFEKPLFNMGIRHALLRDVPNLAVISPASGFEGLAASAGRIVEHNVGVGQGVGIASVIAALEQRDLADISNAEVQQVLARTRQLPQLYAQQSASEVARLEAFEVALINRTGNTNVA